MKKPSKKIVVATANRHKAAELSALLSLPGLEFVPLSDFPGAGPVEEDGRTLEENAVKKARSAAAATGLRALADDTGLEVEALGGAPGVYSARYAGEGCSYADNNARLLRALAGVPAEARRAAFRCVIALCSPDGSTVTAEGRVSGRILEEPRGADGFGYDPLFLPDGSESSFAELAAEEKNSLSHRYAAVRNMLPHLEKLADEQD
ncbi:MAG: dITP/XTP pyrophosphatase [Elusimicrobia bacterium]|nr:MAG: dITP/XTP pyrophosphatase [Elusimicrobiota bacterium]KAF0155614.1 MAG: dITP/XTP pyrophosphatase [Elusimicrobiota bacterium]